MVIYLVIIGFLTIACAICFFYYRRKENEYQQHKNQFNEIQIQQNSIIARKDAEIEIALQKAAIMESEREKALADLKRGVEAYHTINAQKATFEAQNQALQQKLAEQKTEIEEIQKRFTTEFENIAHRLFKEHSNEFRENSAKSLGDILSPLKEKITSFEKKVEDTYTEEMKHRESLKTEVNKLFDLNKEISLEAHNLTKALKGDSKVMGDWGEVILERILQQSGLEEGTMYKTQFSATDAEGSRLRPDVVVFLPDNKHIIIDSKVSLVAYERYVNAEAEEDRKKHLKDHINSVYNHINNLSKKSYQNLSDLHSPDFVLLFIPVEASFSLAIREDIALFDEAWKNQIVIVSPSTLLATLKTIQSIWKQEKQTKNAMEIAAAGGALYDKFVGFAEDLEKIGKNLTLTQSSLSEAMNKLNTGKGNLVSQTERLKRLGAKANKSIPDKLFNAGDLPLIEGEG